MSLFRAYLGRWAYSILGSTSKELRWLARARFSRSTPKSWLVLQFYKALNPILVYHRGAILAFPAHVKKVTSSRFWYLDCQHRVCWEGLWKETPTSHHGFPEEVQSHKERAPLKPKTFTVVHQSLKGYSILDWDMP